jgi:predicted transcriptional regulator
MSPERPLLTEKQLACELLRQMPESATLQQISEELALLAAIRRAEAAADTGHVISHEEVLRTSAAWPSE